MAIAHILQVYMYHHMTDRWGAIPYSQALKGADNISPALDQQQDVYTGLFAQLEAAMGYINSSSVQVQGDIMFGGDMNSWRRFANTLKMTMALRISDVDPSTAQSKFTEAVNGGVLSSTSQNVHYPYLTADAHDNPWQDRFDTRDKSERDGDLDLVYNHIVLLAKNQIGLENLNKISELSWTDGFFKKPRFDFTILEKYKEGIIVTSACPSSVIVKALEEEEFALAKKYIQWFKDTFGSDYYIEVMPHNEAQINKYLIELADEFSIKVVVTPDCHHVDQSQREIQEFKLLLNTHGKVNKEATYEKSKKQPDMMKRLDYLYGEDRQITFNKFDIHLLSYEEIKAAMEAQGIDRPDIYSNTLLLAETVGDYGIQEGLNLLPVQYKSPDKELKKIAYEGLEQRGFADNPEYIARVEEELQIIKDKKSYTAKFLKKELNEYI